jgi:long-chain acyl-CoA synthetase
MLKWWGPILDEYYAATEGGGTSVSAVEWLARPGTVGRPYPGANVKVLQASGEPCAAAQIGKVYLKVQAPFEYYKDPDTTLAGRHGDYFTLGDLGYLDEAGYLFLVDRESDVIISGGVNIYPAEIEGVLSGHPFIADAAVVGIPDDEWGERVHAIVELAQGTSESSLSSEEVIEYCRARLAAYKCPRSIEFRPDLPRLESGKLQRGKLRAAFWEGRARAI